MAVTPVMQRLAELWTINKRQGLTDAEMMEMHHALASNASYCFKMAHLENLSLIAYEIGDVEWHHEICAEIEKALTNQ